MGKGSVSKTSERNRRTAEGARKRRANESEETRILRLRKRSQWDKDRLGKEAEEKRILRLKTRAEQARVRRANESEELRMLRLTKSAESARIRRAKETESLISHLTVTKEQNEESPSNQTKEGRILRLQRRAKKAQLKRDNETAEQRSLRLQIKAKNARLRRDNETPEQRILRLQKEMLATKLRRANERKKERTSRQLHRQTKLQSSGFSQVTETEEESTLRVTQQAMSDKESRTTDDCPMLMEINRMKVSLAALRSAGLAVVKHHVRIAVEKFTGRKVQEPKHGAKIGKESRTKSRHKQGEKWLRKGKGIMSIPLPMIDDHSNSDSGVSKLFVCIVCKEKFDNQNGIIVHIRHHDGLEISNAKQQYELTNENLHDKEALFSVYKCEICSEIFLFISKYRQHLINTHRENKDLVQKFCSPCSICDELFESRAKLVYHQKIEHGIFVQCPICNESITTEDLFAAHLSESHPEISNSTEIILKCSKGLFCKICGFISTNYIKVSSHFHKIHSESKSFECDICQQRFAFKRSLETHKLNVHAVKVHCCEICGKRFSSRSFFMRHKKEHGKLNKQPKAECKECKRMFANVRTLQVHISAVHKKEKPYQCAVCGMAFSCQSTLHIHKTLVCEKEKAKTAPCPICGKVLENYVVLRYHKANIHRYGNTEETFCHVCNRSFKNSLSLWSHNNICHNQKSNRNTQSNVNWICAVCEKSFTTKKLLYSHWQTHREERPFHCSLCPVMFKQRSGFYLHKKLKHKNDQNNAKLITDSQTLQKLTEDFNLIHKKEQGNKSVTENTENQDGNINQHDIIATEFLPGTRFSDGVGLNCQDLDEMLTESNMMVAEQEETAENQEDNVNREVEREGHGLIKVAFNQESNKLITEDDRVDKNKSDVAKLQIVANEKSCGKSEPSPNSDFDNGLCQKNLPVSLPEESEKISESEYSFEDDDELVDHYACQDSPGAVFDEDDCKLVDRKMNTFTHKRFLQDPFTSQLIVQLVKLKEYPCSLCDKVFYTSQLYKKHLNCRNHRSASKNLKIKFEHTTGDRTRAVKNAAKMKRKYKKRIRGKRIVTDRSKLFCAICGKYFASVSNLCTHRRLHTDTYRKQCPQCDKSFTRKYQYEQHVQAHLGRRFRCEICGNVYKREYHVKCHLKTHSDVEIEGEKFKEIFLTETEQKEDLACSICDEVFPSSKLYKEHLKSVSHVSTAQLNPQTEISDLESNFEESENTTDTKTKQKSKLSRAKGVSENKKYCCEICGKQLKSSGSLYIHRKRHAIEKQCEQCDKSFKCKYSYDTHVQSEHFGKRFVCEICGSTFHFKSKLKRHRKTHEPKTNELKANDNSEEHICEICGKVYGSREKLTKHRYNSHSERDFRCDPCAKSFFNAAKLRDHINVIHLKIKYPCTECGKECSSKSSLNQHIWRHKETQPPKKTWQCDQCSHTFKEKRYYLHHMNKHQGIKVTCEVCGQVFSSPISMRKHRKSHLNSQYFFCSFCSLSFNRQESYDNHVQSIHDSSRPFPCDQCHSFFMHKSNLLQHKKNAHLKLGIVYKKKKKSPKPPE